jgi:hypothetical protein
MRWIGAVFLIFVGRAALRLDNLVGYAHPDENETCSYAVLLSQGTRKWRKR